MTRSNPREETDPACGRAAHPQERWPAQQPWRIFGRGEGVEALHK